MKRMGKIALTSVALLLPMIMLAGCTKVSLTGSTSTTGAPDGAQMGTPPTDGGTPPTGTPPAGAPTGAPSN